MMTPEEEQALLNDQLSSQLLPPQEPPPNTALVAPGEYQPRYGEADRMDPRRQFWAGMLTDIGNSLMAGGRTGQLGPMQGLGLRSMMNARQYNQGLDKANAAAQRQHMLDRNAYGNAMYGRGRHDVADAQWQAQQDALAAQREQAQSNADRNYALQQEQVQQGWAQIASKAATAGASAGLERTKATNDLVKDYSALQKPMVEGLRAGDKALALLDNPNPVSDYSALYAFANVLDPGAIVTDSDRDALPQINSLKDQLVAQVDALKSGKSLDPKLRENMRNTVATLNAMQMRSYQAREGQYHEILRDSGLDADIVLGGTGYAGADPVQMPTPPPTLTAEQRAALLQQEGITPAPSMMDRLNSFGQQGPYANPLAR